MDIRNLIDRPASSQGQQRPSVTNDSERRQSSSVTSSPVIESRRHTVSSLLNDDSSPPPGSSYNSPVLSKLETPSHNLLLNAQPNGETGGQHPINNGDDLGLSSSNGNADNISTPSRTSASSSKPSPSISPHLESINVKKNKPIRYESPPIWAHKWTKQHSRSKQIQYASNPSSDLAHKSSLVSAGDSKNSNNRLPTVASSQYASAASVTMSGLPISMTGVLPYENITRKISEWLFSQLFQLGPNRQYIELELKFGLICDKRTEKRINIPALTETILHPDYVTSSTFFQASMSDEEFSYLHTFLESLTLEGRQMQNANRPSSKEPLVPPLIKTSLKTKDVFYRMNDSDRVRISFDENENQVERIVKQRIGDLMLYSPGVRLDTRISLSVELPQTTADFNVSNQNPILTRAKNRQTYKHPGIQMDLTSVITERDHAKKETSKELELELDGSLILQYYDSFQDKSDPKAMDKFEELVRIGLDNSRILSRRLSRD